LGPRLAEGCPLPVQLFEQILPVVQGLRHERYRASLFSDWREQGFSPPTGHPSVPNHCSGIHIMLRIQGAPCLYTRSEAHPRPTEHQR
jgi:hypothetical protein